MRLVLPLLALAPIVQAGEFTPPSGCTVYLTVQSRSCTVSHHWTCEGNAPGHQWSGDIEANGLSFVGQIDSEAQWLKSYFNGAAEEETLIEPATDPASLTDLFATGRDTFDFMMDTTNGLQRVVGVDRIEARDVLIDGERLHRTAYDISISAQDGTVIYAAQGSEYVSEKHRRFFSGAGTFRQPEAPIEYDQTPVDFIYPGEAGFLSDQPKYDCAVVTARHVTQEEDPQQ